jgi:DivIVA domain-containing protein
VPLTPQDIVRKEFREAFRGYNQTDVDLFLDEVVDEITRLIDDNQKMRVRLAALQQELARYRDARSARADEQMASRYGSDDPTQERSAAQQRRPLPNMPKPEDPFGPTSERPSPPPPSAPRASMGLDPASREATPPVPGRREPAASEAPSVDRTPRPPAEPDQDSTQPHRPSPEGGERWRPPAGSERPFWGGD